jgi:hypothetical protein
MKPLARIERIEGRDALKVRAQKDFWMVKTSIDMFIFFGWAAW